MEQKDKNEIARIRWIRDHLREIAEDKNDLQENFTPLEVCDMMLDKVDLNAAKSILVLYNIEIIFALRLREYKGEVTFFTSSLKKCEIAPKFLPQVKIEYIEKDKDPFQHLSMAFPDKFDVVIANPPYGSGDTNTNLDTLFLEKCISLSKKEIVFIHPSKLYVRDYSIKKDTGGFSDLLNCIGNTLNSLDIFNANDLFDTSLDYPIVIAHFRAEKVNPEILVRNIIYNKEDIFKDIKDINLFGSGEIFQNLKKKIQELNLRSLSSERKKLNRKITSPDFLRNNISKRWIMRLQARSGSTFKKGDKTNLLFKNDFFTFFRSNRENDGQLIFDTQVIDDDTLFGLLKGSYIWWEFDTYNECLNFVKYLKLTSTRGFLSLIKIDRNLDSNMFLVPWMDFTQEWTDERLYKHFNITEEEQAFIKEIIPPYYDTGGTETED